MQNCANNTVIYILIQLIKTHKSKTNNIIKIISLLVIKKSNEKVDIICDKVINSLIIKNI